MRTYRFHSLDRPGADSLADDLRGQRLAVAVIRPGRRPVPGWVVEATGDDQNEEWLEVLARFYGGTYEREDLTAPEPCFGPEGRSEEGRGESPASLDVIGT